MVMIKEQRMDYSKVRKALEITTSVAVVLAASALVVLIIAGFLSRPMGIQAESGFQKGKVLPKIARLDYSDSSRTLLIALSQQCDYCDESMPVYKKLVDFRQEGKTSNRIVALLPTTDVEAIQLVKQNQLNIDTIGEVDFNSLNIKSTPTLILVDNRGVVIDFWLGKLSSEDEQQILNTWAGRGR